MTEEELAAALTRILDDGAPSSVRSAEFVADIGLARFDEPTTAVRGASLVDTTDPSRERAVIRQPYPLTRDVYVPYFTAAKSRGEDVSQVEIRFERASAASRFLSQVRTITLEQRRALLADVRPVLARLRQAARQHDPDSPRVSVSFDEDPLRKRAPVLVVHTPVGPIRTPPPPPVDAALAELRAVHWQKRLQLKSLYVSFHLDEREDDNLTNRSALVASAFADQPPVADNTAASPSADDDMI